MRVWHNCQVGAVDNFYVDVNSVEEAIKVLKTLWDYDLFQYENGVKPDYCNASGLEEFNEKTNDWEEYYNENGEDITEIIRNSEEK